MWEVESGKKNDRKELQLAIDLCRKEGHGLVVAKLDRLGRNISHLSRIREEVSHIFCCDNPSMDTVQFGIFATFAQHEREMISLRTKAALAAKKARGEKLGREKGYKHNEETKRKISRTRKERAMAKLSRDEKMQMIVGMIKILQKQGFGSRKIANQLNEANITTLKGGKFFPATVGRIIKRFELQEKKA